MNTGTVEWFGVLGVESKNRPPSALPGSAKPMPSVSSWPSKAGTQSFSYPKDKEKGRPQGVVPARPAGGTGGNSVWRCLRLFCVLLQLLAKVRRCRAKRGGETGILCSKLLLTLVCTKCKVITEDLRHRGF